MLPCRRRLDRPPAGGAGDAAAQRRARAGTSRLPSGRPRERGPSIASRFVVHRRRPARAPQWMSHRTPPPGIRTTLATCCVGWHASGARLRWPDCGRRAARAATTRIGAPAAAGSGTRVAVLGTRRRGHGEPPQRRAPRLRRGPAARRWLPPHLPPLQPGQARPRVLYEVTFQEPETGAETVRLGHAALLRGRRAERLWFGGGPQKPRTVRPTPPRAAGGARRLHTGAAGDRADLPRGSRSARARGSCLGGGDA